MKRVMLCCVNCCCCFIPLMTSRGKNSVSQQKKYGFNSSASAFCFALRELKSWSGGCLHNFATRSEALCLIGIILSCVEKEDFFTVHVSTRAIPSLVLIQSWSSAATAAKNWIIKLYWDKNENEFLQPPFLFAIITIWALKMFSENFAVEEYCADIALKR